VKCERCGEKEGTIRYMELIGGVAHKQQVCADCARELGFGPPTASSPAEPAAEGAAPVVPSVFGGTMLVASLPDDTRCPGCGLRLAELQNVSLLGCPRCYETYGELLGPALERLHGTDVHHGRRPPGSGDAPAGDGP